MSEIKFRGKLVDSGKWVYGYYFYSLDGRAYILTQVTPTLASIKFQEVDVNTVGQFTGLYDKDKREIYEGDIIKGVYDNWFYKNKLLICTVDWDSSGYWTFRGIKNFTGGYLTDLQQVEIIGNIYENKDLLEGGCL